MAEIRLYRMAQLVTRLNMSAQTLRRLIDKGLFPRPVYPVEGMPRWTAHQVETYLAAVEMGIVHPDPEIEKKPPQKKGSQEQSEAPTSAHKRPQAPN